MFVKMLDGRFAGEVKDLRSDVALEFIRQKRAERAFQDPAPVIAEQSPVAQLRQAVANVAAKTARKKAESK